MSLGSLLIYGAGGHGRVVADAAREAGWQLAAWGDGDPARDGQVIGGAPVRVTTPEAAARLARNQGYFVVVAIGDNGARRRVFLTLEELGLTFATIVHPRAVVAASAELGPGTVVFAGGVVNADARLGKNVILNTAATVDHDGRIGDHA
ncbi:MAG: hypothetical protein KDD47_20810, partial [Acidobacteria bacterium]|nr:hypothetical protein [Acidobacteriota bacterium]